MLCPPEASPAPARLVQAGARPAHVPGDVILQRPRGTLAPRRGPPRSLANLARTVLEATNSSSRAKSISIRVDGSLINKHEFFSQNQTPPLHHYSAPVLSPCNSGFA
jgi:hypothetical protein